MGREGRTRESEIDRERESRRREGIAQLILYAICYVIVQANAVSSSGRLAIKTGKQALTNQQHVYPCFEQFGPPALPEAAGTT
jgi:hypothetical protein